MPVRSRAVVAIRSATLGRRGVHGPDPTQHVSGAGTGASWIAYTRGLAFHGPIAFVGLSKIRESAVFGGLPIGARADELRCGVAAVDLRTGRSVAWFQFSAGIDEVFDVQVIPNTRLAKISGPNHTDDGDAAVWLVPPVAAMPRS